MFKRKVLLAVLLVTLSLRPGYAQTGEIRFLIDTSISIMKDRAVNASAVNWEKIRSTAYQKAAGLNSPYQLGPVMRYIYQSLNDFHGAFFYRDSVFQWRREQKPAPDSIMAEWKKGSGIKTGLFPGHIGYLRIPSMPGGSKEEFSGKAQQLNDSLCYLLNKNIKGLVLDLRLDGGGAMHPMILGVEQLLQPGVIGFFQTKKKEAWIIKDHSFVVDTEQVCHIIPLCDKNSRKLPVVMITGPVTGSAAECFIIAFKGRKNTVLLGSPTAGYVTVNAGIPIDDTSFMNLSIGYNADRYGRIYKEAIKPDIPYSATDRFNDLANDEKVQAAIRWLRKHAR